MCASALILNLFLSQHKTRLETTRRFLTTGEYILPLLGYAKKEIALHLEESVESNKAKCLTETKRTIE